MSDVYLFPSAPEPKDVMLRPIPPIPPVPPQYNIHLPIRYIGMFVQIKRNGEIVAYATPYTPFRTERPIQT